MGRTFRLELFCLLASCLAAANLLEAGTPATCAIGNGNCCIANGTPGCDDGGTGCCAAVCDCDPFCCTLEWDEICATTGSRGNGCGAMSLCEICSDADGDGVLDDHDVCCNTPVGVIVDQSGRPVGDFDLDCDVDVRDYRFFNRNFTGQLADGIPCDDALCTIDGDCDDDLFCNGVESCDNGLCISTGNPCDGGSSCDEEKDACIPDKGFLVLTFGPDFLTGSAAADHFIAPAFLNGQRLIPTWGNTDFLDGLAGTDTITAQLAGGGAITPGSLAGIEQVNLQVVDEDDITLFLQNATAVAAVSNENSQAGLTVTNLTTVPSQITWRDGSHAFNLGVTASLLVGNNDDINIELSDIMRDNPGDQPVLTVSPLEPGSGFEAMNLISMGTKPNTLFALRDGVGDSWEYLSVAGPAPLTIESMIDSTVVEIDASASSGGVDIGVVSISIDTECRGGTGNDRFDFSFPARGYDNGDTVDGGLGVDTLALAGSDATVFLQQTNVTNVEFIQVMSPFQGVIDVTRFGASTAQSATGFIADATLGAGTVIVPSGGTVVFNKNPKGNPQILSATARDDDLLTLIMNSNWTGNAQLETWEAVELEANAVIGLDSLVLNQSPAVETVTITGDQLVLFAAVTADVIDATALLNELQVYSVSPGPVTVTGGIADDIIVGSPQDDTLSGGQGDDSLAGKSGNDMLAGGPGSDLFAFEFSASFNGQDLVTDFEPADVLDLKAFVSADAPNGSVDDTDAAEIEVLDGQIWIVNDPDGSIDAPSDVADLFGTGRPFAAGETDKEVALLIRDTSLTGSTTIWYVEDAAIEGIQPDECTQVVTLSGFNSLIGDDNIRD